MRFITLTLIAIAVAILTTAITLKIMRSSDRRTLSKTLVSLQASGAGVLFEGEMVRDLPEAARRWFLHAIAPGTPLASSVDLKLTGRIRLAPDQPWLAYQAHEVISGSRGFAWDLSVQDVEFQFDGSETLIDGEASRRYWLHDFLPSTQEGDDLQRSLAGRFLLEHVFLPSALLPDQGAVWRGLGSDQAEVALEIGESAYHLEFTLGDDGSPQNLRMQRWGDRSDDGFFQFIPFGARVSEHLTVGGYTIPKKLSYAWWSGTDREEVFLEINVEAAEYR